MWCTHWVLVEIAKVSFVRRRGNFSCKIIIFEYFSIYQVSFGNPKYFNKVVDCLIKALNEYTLDNRGDIGAWVREAAMNGIIN